MKLVVKSFVAIFFCMAASELVFLNTLSASETPGQGDKIQLRLKLEKGKTYKIKMNTQQKINQEVMNNKLEINQTIGMGIDFKVKDVDEKNIYTIDIVYKSVLYKQSGSPMGPIEYDSTKPNKNIPAQAKGFAALVGLSLGLKMNSLGEVKEVTGSKKFMDKLIKNIDVPDGPQKEIMNKAIKKQFGEKAIKKMLSDMTCTYPEKALAISDSWPKSVSMGNPLPLIMDGTWTLKKRSQGIVYLSVKSKLKPNPDPKIKPITIGSMKQKIEVSGTQTGTLMIEEKTGWTKKSNLIQDLSGTITITGPYSMKIPIKLKSIITIIGE